MAKSEENRERGGLYRSSKVTEKTETDGNDSSALPGLGGQEAQFCHKRSVLSLFVIMNSSVSSVPFFTVLSPLGGPVALSRYQQF